MKRIKRVRQSVIAAPVPRIVFWSGHGRASWPSKTDPDRHFSLRVADNRKDVACSCPDARALSAGEPCEHGRDALKFVCSYVDKHGLWAKAFQFELRDPEPTTKQRTVRKGPKFFKDAKREPEVRFEFPDGTRLQSRANQGRRKWGKRVPEFLEQLMSGSKSRLQQIEHRNRRRISPKTGQREMGAGAKGIPLAHRLYAVVTRAFSTSLADEATTLADSIRAVQHLGNPPSENSICNYFHDEIVLSGLRIWLAMTARAVHRLAQYAIADSTGFATSLVEVWLESEHGTLCVRATSTWLKCHVLSDAATNIIGAIIPSSNRGISADVKMLKHLIRLALAAGWHIRAVLGDKAYFDQKVRNWCQQLGMILFVPLKRGTTAATREQWDRHNGVLAEKGIFKALMRYRPKIESVFSAWKRMFDPYAMTRVTEKHGKRRSGLSISQEIELLSRGIAFNLRRLATLEEILDQEIDLARGIYFHPMPDGWCART